MSLKLLKTHPDAKATRYKHITATTGYDLYSVEASHRPSVEVSSRNVPVGSNISDILTPGCWFRIEPRSGLGFKHNLQPHLGIIDNGYRGDLGVKAI